MFPCPPCVIPSSQQGLQLPNHVDVSRGLESVPVLSYEGDSSEGIPALDKSYKYVRSLAIHASVSVTTVRAASMVTSGHSSVEDDASSGQPRQCSCKLGKGELHYVGDGLLHPRYIVQV